MISQTAEYALRAVVWLAAQNSGASGTSLIAEATRVPTGYLSKVLQGLARRGLVISSSGRNGGFRLTRAATEVSVLDVIQAVSPLGRIRRCPLGIESHDGGLCPLHRRLNEAVESIEKAFGAVTIAQLLQEQDVHSSLWDAKTIDKGQAESASTTIGQSGAATKAGRRRGIEGVSARRNAKPRRGLSP